MWSLPHPTWTLDSTCYAAAPAWASFSPRTDSDIPHCSTTLHGHPPHPAWALTPYSRPPPAMSGHPPHPSWACKLHITCPHAWIPFSPHMASDTPPWTAILQGSTSSPAQACWPPAWMLFFTGPALTPPGASCAGVFLTLLGL
uniref:cDNA FLJ41930 fis, clone PERIC2004379 n=1 Tax=Homo sapiens TaxID=9606 RepID=Q6ZVY2_HUMAN|nr:unnamed protein product [Homo sapiens]